MSKQAFFLTPSILAAVLEYTNSLPRGESYLQSQKGISGIKNIRRNEINAFNAKAFDDPNSSLFGGKNRFNPGNHGNSLILS